MPYITPVTNRTLSSPGYFNVADWTRIYGNAKIVNSLVEILIMDGTLDFPVIAEPSITSIPSITDFNNLLEAIETFRSCYSTIYTVATQEIKYDWVAGVGEKSLNYKDVNLWENTIDLVWGVVDGASFGSCPTLSSDLIITTSNLGIYIDCLNAADYDIDLQGTARLFII